MRPGSSIGRAVSVRLPSLPPQATENRGRPRPRSDSRPLANGPWNCSDHRLDAGVLPFQGEPLGRQRGAVAGVLLEQERRAGDAVGFGLVGDQQAGDALRCGGEAAGQVAQFLGLGRRRGGLGVGGRAGRGRRSAARSTTSPPRRPAREAEQDELDEAGGHGVMAAHPAALPGTPGEGRVSLSSSPRGNSPRPNPLPEYREGSAALSRQTESRPHSGVTSRLGPSGPASAVRRARSADPAVPACRGRARRARLLAALAAGTGRSRSSGESGPTVMVPRPAGPGRLTGPAGVWGESRPARAPGGRRQRGAGPRSPGLRNCASGQSRVSVSLVGRQHHDLRVLVLAAEVLAGRRQVVRGDRALPADVVGDGDGLERCGRPA